MGAIDWLTGQDKAEDYTQAGLNTIYAGTGDAVGSQEEYLNSIMNLQQPYMDTGGRNLSGLEGMANEQYADVEPFSISDPTASPLYAWQQQQGEQAINRAAAARGGYGDTATVENLSNFNRALGAEESQRSYGRDIDAYNMRLGLADREVASSNRQFQRLSDLVNMGKSATNVSSEATSQTGANISNLQQRGAIANANIYGNRASSYTDFSPLNLASDAIGALGGAKGIYDAGKGIYDVVTGAKTIGEAIGMGGAALEGSSALGAGAYTLGDLGGGVGLPGLTGYGADALSLGGATEVASGLTNAQLAGTVGETAANTIGEQAVGSGVKQTLGSSIAEMITGGSGAAAGDLAALGTTGLWLGGALAIDAIFDLGVREELTKGWTGAGKEAQTKQYMGMVDALSEKMNIPWNDAEKIFRASQLGSGASMMGAGGGFMTSGMSNIDSPSSAVTTINTMTPEERAKFSRAFAY